MKRRRFIRVVDQPSSAFAGFPFPPDVILIANQWYLRYGLFYRDLEELLAERGVERRPSDPVPVGSAVHPGAGGGGEALPRAAGGHWFVDDTYVKGAGSWRSVYRAVDQSGEVIDVFSSKKRDLRAATVADS
jgi:transposase, IS6 family